MRFRVFHRTRYVYRAPVRDSYNEVRLRPATDDKSRLEFFLLNTHPPARLQHFRDNWFNYVHYFDLPEPHSSLTIEAQSTINTTSPYQDGGKPSGVTFAALKAGLDDIVQPFLVSSKYVDLSPEVWRLGLDIRDDRNDVFAVAEAVMHHIYREWSYAPNTTHAATHMNEVVATKRGVCQDFAHVMIGVCRSLGIPARYVSGYLYNGPDSHLRGTQASHAWCEVHLPGKGWFGLDPTNNTLADERHIKIATGRDYHDAAPITGYFDGPPGATSALQVALEVRRMDG
ncbi:MAG TPA: transglutaminase family protein [Verrucomicrobiales bacterium]|nr:transglutaminase family protein [Verrucomicrobiales bacterium]